MFKTKALFSMGIAVCLLLTGCGSDTPQPTSSNPPESSERANTLSGIVQKGAFLIGSTITAWQLDDQGQRTEKTLSNKILESSGKYSITLDWSGWTELQVQGRYFDEYSGKESTQEIQLTSIVELVSENTNKNVNLFTHLLARRNNSLISTGQPMATAFQTALSETQTLAGLGAINPNSLDLTDGSGNNAKDNAILLLFSGAFLANSGDNATLERLTQDFADDGQINGDAIADFSEIGNRAGDATLLNQLTNNLKEQGIQDAPDSTDLGDESLPWSNKAPIIVMQSHSVDEDSSVSITLTGTDADSETLSYSTSAPSNGTLSGTSPNIIYSPNANFNGSDSFTFTASDGAIISEPADINITINAVNDAPVANAQTQILNEDSSVSIPLNGSDIDQDTLTSRIMTPPANGTLSGTTPNLNYTPKANYHGTDSFSFVVNDGNVDSAPETVSFTITPLNDSPTANDQALLLDEDTSLSIILTGSDIDSDSLSYIVITPPTEGTLSGLAPNLSYTPEANFSGSDSFIFKVDDGTEDSEPATISLTINDNDFDNDDVLDAVDNCPTTVNGNQTNTDTDAQGDACDDDDDNDGVADTKDEKPLDKTTAATMESAHRLLLQTTFGPTLNEITRVEKIGIDAWVEEELNKPSAYDSGGSDYKTHVERLIEIAQTAEPNTDWFGTSVFNQSVADHNSDDYHMAAWWENAIGLHPIHSKQGSDQLRQRVAFALSQILVVSNSEAPLDRRGEALAYYYDILTEHAPGNYRDLLEHITKSPAMGIYLSHQGNRKTIPTEGTRPDENFAREMMQLFTIGLYQLNTNGSADIDGDPNTPDISTSSKDLVPSYEQSDIEALAKVMTGWDLADNSRYGWTGTNQGNYMIPMEFTPEEHEDEGALNGDGNVTLLGKTFSLDSGDGTGIKAALDTLFNHQNVAPLVSKHLIMRLVTSNPTPEYVARVAEVFNNNGSNIRGDLKSVVRAILMDVEARGDAFKTDRFFGKAKEPILAFSHLLRAFGAVPLNGWFGEDGTTVVNNIYWLRAPEQSFAQGPLRAHSVFNFYSPDFVPSDTDFAINKKVSPEMQIQTDQILVEYSNKVFLLSRDYEENYRNEVYKTYTTFDADIADLAGYAASKSFWSSTMPIINFDREFILLEQALEGDSNGDFSNMDNPESKQAAVKALIAHLNKLLLGGTMSLEYEAAMEHYLLNGAGLSNTNNFVEAFNLIQNAVRLIATSSSYMIQK